MSLMRQYPNIKGAQLLVVSEKNLKIYMDFIPYKVVMVDTADNI